MPYKTLILIILTFSGLTACDAGVSNPVPAINGATQYPVVIQHARVTLSIVGPDSIRQVAVTETDATGGFDIDPVSAPGQLVLVEVSPATDGRSRIVCDRDSVCGAHVPGAGSPLPGSFRMLALYASEELAGVELSVNPFTHLAAMEAIRLEGMITPASLARARASVANRHGVDNRFWNAGEVVGGAGEVMRGKVLASVNSRSRTPESPLARYARSSGEVAQMVGTSKGGAASLVF